MTQNKKDILILTPEQRVYKGTDLNINEGNKKLLIDSYNEASKTAREESANYGRLRGTVFLATLGLPTLLSRGIDSGNQLYDAFGGFIMFAIAYAYGTKINSTYQYQQHINKNIRRFVADKKADLIYDFNKKSHGLTDYEDMFPVLKKASPKTKMNADDATAVLNSGVLISIIAVAGLNASQHLKEEGSINLEDERVRNLLEYVEGLQKGEDKTPSIPNFTLEKK